MRVCAFYASRSNVLPWYGQSLVRFCTPHPSTLTAKHSLILSLDLSGTIPDAFILSSWSSSWSSWSSWSFKNNHFVYYIYTSYILLKDQYVPQHPLEQSLPCTPTSTQRLSYRSRLQLQHPTKLRPAFCARRSSPRWR